MLSLWSGQCILCIMLCIMGEALCGSRQCRPGFGRKDMSLAHQLDNSSRQSLWYAVFAAGHKSSQPRSWVNLGVRHSITLIVDLRTCWGAGRARLFFPAVYSKIS
jgi:hypothetical protein